MSKIKKCYARKIIDSRGAWTVEATVETESGVRGVASVPQGKSTGEREAVSLSVDEAVSNVENKINGALAGIEVSDQEKIDETLIKFDGTKNKSNLGANAILGVSFAVARAAAMEGKIALWQHLRNIYDGGRSPTKTFFEVLGFPRPALQARPDHQKKSLSARFDVKPPRLFANCINGGLHAGSGLDIQEYMVVPNFPTVKENVDFTVKFYKTLGGILVREFGPTATEVGDEGGFAPKMRDNLAPLKFMSEAIGKLNAVGKVDLAIDAAASNIKKSSEELRVFYLQMTKDYGLFSIEDPFGENDTEDFVSLTKEFAGRPMIIGDDLTTTNPIDILKTAKAGAINGVIIKPNQIGTVTETLEAIRMARKYKLFVIVSHRSGETDDDFIADLAWAVGADGIKLGAPARGERIAKYNRLLEIETGST